MNILYKLFVVVFLSIFLFLISTNAITSSELTYLNSKNITVEEGFLNQNQVSRGDAIYYLNYSDGLDCSNPSKNIKDILNENWWNGYKISQDTNLDDIEFGQDNFYCIAYGAYNNYIHGYENNGGFCSGKFCANNNITQGELVQVVTNILSTAIYKQYNFKSVENVKSWTNSIKENYSQYGLTSNDYNTVENINNRCVGSCSIETIDEFSLYKKFCAYNLESCGFSVFQGIESNSSLSVSLNIIMKQNIIRYDEANNFDPTKLITGEELIEWLYEIKQIKTDSVDTDYDGDNILNKNDNCISTYNPSQSDIDGDNLGNVCDDDIDGDGITNPIGIVDDNDNILYYLIEKKQDNCLFLVNNDQKDSDNNNIGDVCESYMQNYIGISISCNPMEGYKSFHTNCSATTVGTVSKIDWDFGDLNTGNGKSVSHTYQNAGVFTISASAIGENKSIAIASLEIKVGDKEQNTSIGFSIYGTEFQGKAPKKLGFATRYSDTIDEIILDFGEGKVYNIVPGKSVSKNFSYPGIYTAKATAMKGTTEVAKASAHFTLDANDDSAGYGAYLSSTKLKAVVGEKIGFQITPFNFSLTGVDYILWDWGDGSNPEKKQTLTHYYNYLNEGIYEPTVKIYLETGRVMTLSLTEKVVSAIDGVSTYGMTFFSDNLKNKVDQEVSYTINLKSIQKSDIKRIVWKYGDATTYIDETDLSFTSKHIYNVGGVFKVSAQLILKDDTSLYSSLTQVIYGNEYCYLWALGQYNGFKCDMDGDDIPDVCDENIDGDNYNNLLGILTKENTDCSFTSDLTNNIILQKEYALASKGKEIDNCPFIENDLQSDSNGNGIGNTCEVTEDSDSDGIADDVDKCVNLPENINGIEDKDGCPEISTQRLTFTFNTKNCQTCPCHRADWDCELKIGDKIWAILVNPYSQEEIYNVSDGFVIGK